MTIPAVMALEEAIDMIIDRGEEPATWPPLVENGPHTSTRDRTLHEFRMLGPARLGRFGAELRRLRAYTDLELGYLLGLEVARLLEGGYGHDEAGDGVPV